ncbi:MAG: hypothetical protein IKO42_05600, partial [Opitutales bacterium]|nr:hypothetical protein [Opitutales bacterium]
SACKVLALGDNPDELIYTSSSVAYKVTGENTASLKLTLSYFRQAGADKSVKKVVLDGNVTFDEIGNGVFVFKPTGNPDFDNPTYTYTLERKLPAGANLPETLANKTMSLNIGLVLAVDSTGKKGIDQDSNTFTITYKYISQSVATFTLKTAYGTFSDGIIMVDEGQPLYRFTVGKEGYVQGTLEIADGE